MKIKEFFATHPVFRYEQFAAFMTTISTTRPESWRQQLSYLMSLAPPNICY